MKALILRFLALLMACLALSAVAVERMVDPASGVEFVLVPAGCFVMGADKAEAPSVAYPIPMPAPDEIPAHEVCVDSFWLARSETDRSQWTKVTGRTLYPTNVPVSNVSWEDAVRFTEQLTALGGGRFRLPTEAEWEYACHAGVVRPADQFADRLELSEKTAEMAWFRYKAGRDPTFHTVMKKAPNTWGLHDILGNLWEWTLDGYDPTAYGRHTKDNPVQLPIDERRVVRGGSYLSDISQTRCGARNFAPLFDRSPVFGFRVVREVDLSKK